MEKVAKAVEILKDSLPENALVEPVEITSKKAIIVVVSDTFEGLEESDRQDLLWNTLKNEFGHPSAEFKELLNHLGFILTWTPEEKRVFEEEEWGEEE